MRRSSPRLKLLHSSDLESPPAEDNIFSDLSPIQSPKPRKRVRFHLSKNISDDSYSPPAKSVKHPAVRTPSLVKGKEPVVAKFPRATTRLSPKSFVQVVERLHYNQWCALQEIGFGGLYWLRVNRLPLQLGYWLIDNFNPYSNSILLPDGQRLIVSASSVRDTFGLPMGPNPVILSGFSADSDDFGEFYTNWKSQFGVSDGQVQVQDLVDFIIDHTDSGDQFKVNFVVLAVSLLMRNNQKTFVNHHVLKSLMTVGEIQNFNWCEFVMDSLRSAKKEWVDKANHFAGPVLFLLLFYADRVVHGSRTVERDYFTLCNWTSAALFQRQTMEMCAGAFGLGSVDGEMKEVVDLSPSKDVSTMRPSPTSYSSPKEFADDYACTAKRIMEDMVALDEKFSVGVQCFPDEDVIKQAHSATEMVYAVYGGGSVGEFTENQLDFLSKDVEDELIALTKAAEHAYKMKLARIQYRKIVAKVTANAPTNAPVSFDLGVLKDFEAAAASRVVSTDAVGSTNAGHNVVTTEDNQIGSTEDHVDAVVNKVLSDLGDVSTELVEKTKNIQPSFNRPPLYPRIAKKPRSSKTHGYAQLSVLRDDTNPSTPVTPLHTKLSDYVFADSGNSTSRGSEFLFEYKDYSASRCHLWTLKPSLHISSAVIDCWAAYLNYKEQERNPGNQKRFFFSTLVYMLLTKEREGLTDEDRYNSFKRAAEHELQSFDAIDLSSIELFFFPIVRENHYFLFVFDLVRKRFVILDNFLSKGSIEKIYGPTPTLVIDAFGRFLGENSKTTEQSEASNTVMDMEPSVAKLPWRNNDNVDDCGVYIMRHMETFMGPLIWKSRLLKNDMTLLAVLRVKYLCTLITFKENKCCNLILEKAKVF